MRFGDPLRAAQVHDQWTERAALCGLLTRGAEGTMADRVGRGAARASPEGPCCAGRSAVPFRGAALARAWLGPLQTLKRNAYAIQPMRKTVTGM